MNKRKFIVLITILMLILGSVSFADNDCWRRGPTYNLEDNTHVYKRYKGCYHRRSYDYYDSFEKIEYDLYLKPYSGTTSVPGKVGFEAGTTIQKNVHFGFNNIKYYDSRIKDYKDELNYEYTSLNGGSFSNVTNYVLSLAEKNYTLRARLKDKYPGTIVEKTADFYIGPYPTVSCKVTLNDDNKKASHYDSIRIHDIKLKSTYQPNELIFEVYKGNTLLTSYKTTPNTSSSYETGWKSSFNEINNNIGINLKPGEQINIRVRVVDGRGTGTTNITNPNAPKYAKYSSSPVF